MWLRIHSLKVAMVTRLIRMVWRLGLEPSEFPSTEAGKVTGWKDDATDFSLESPGNTVFPLQPWCPGSPYWHVKIHLSFLEEDTATGRAFGQCLLRSPSLLCLKSFAILWHELRPGQNNLGKMSRPYNWSIMALGPSPLFSDVSCCFWGDLLWSLPCW